MENNKYKSFYLCDLEDMIREQALMAMKEPVMEVNQTVVNEMVAIYNDAVGTFAGRLIRVLETPEKDDDEK